MNTPPQPTPDDVANAVNFFDTLKGWGGAFLGGGGLMTAIGALFHFQSRIARVEAALDAIEDIKDSQERMEKRIDGLYSRLGG